MVVCWDWNGTIVDDAFVFVEILNVFLKKNKLPLMTLKKYRSSFCFPISRFYKKINLYQSDESFKQLTKDFVVLYSQKMKEPRLVKNVVSALDFFHKNNIKQCVLSAQNQKTLNYLVGFYGLQKYFSFVVGVENDYALGKANQARLLKKKLDSENLVVVGDTALDWFVSQEIGAQCVLVDWGHSNKKRLLHHSPFVCSSVENLKNLVLSF